MQISYFLHSLLLLTIFHVMLKLWKALPTSIYKRSTLTPLHSVWWRGSIENHLGPSCINRCIYLLFVLFVGNQEQCTTIKDIPFHWERNNTDLLRNQPKFTEMRTSFVHSFWKKLRLACFRCRSACVSALIFFLEFPCVFLLSRSMVNCNFLQHFLNFSFGPSSWSCS